MDRSRKRKAAPEASPESEGSAAKKAKMTQTPESTTRIGLQFLEQVKVAKDKTGRVISDLFLQLPDRNEFPDYYETIKLPISIETIEAKLDQHGYATLSEVESDLKRMVSNAKSYNEDGSIVFADAERIRKMVSNYMTKNNPAYRDPNHVAVATPIPREKEANGQSAPDTPATFSRDASEQARKPTVTINLKNRKAAATAVNSPNPAENATSDTPAPTDDFTGKTFQQAQEQIVNEMISYTEDDMQIFHPFVNLPSRSLLDYYQVIKKPVSLTALKKRTKGQHGRDKPTGISDFKNWDSFEDEASWIWKNATTYNEDGSEMFNLAKQLEQHFKARLALAKQQVADPQQPKITLKGRPKPVLHLGAKASPAPPSTPGVTIDKDALSRQKQAVQTGINGHQTPTPAQRPSLPPSRSASQVSQPPSPAKRAQSGQAQSPPSLPAADVKAEKEKSAVPSPALPDATLQSAVVPTSEPKPVARPATSSMPPPAAPRVPSGSPHPTTVKPVIQATQQPAYVPAPTTFIDHYSRTTPLADALLPNLTITNHPQLNLPKPFRMDIPPSPAFTQQSLTIMLPASHYYVQIAPTVSPYLVSGRQYKLFVTVNGVRLMATNRPFLNGEMNGGSSKQVYDASLLHGVNRIEVEIVAVAGGGRPGTSGTGTLETEKVTIFAHLLRN